MKLELIYEGKEDNEILLGVVLDSLRKLRENAEILGVSGAFWGYAMSAVETANLKMLLDLKKAGVAREPLPFEEAKP